jgi:hypothetical protein
MSDWEYKKLKAHFKKSISTRNWLLQYETNVETIVAALDSSIIHIDNHINNRNKLDYNYGTRWIIDSIGNLQSQRDRIRVDDCPSDKSNLDDSIITLQAHIDKITVPYYASDISNANNSITDPQEELNNPIIFLIIHMQWDSLMIS